MDNALSYETNDISHWLYTFPIALTCYQEGLLKTKIMGIRWSRWVLTCVPVNLELPTPQILQTAIKPVELSFSEKLSFISPEARLLKSELQNAVHVLSDQTDHHCLNEQSQDMGSHSFFLLVQVVGLSSLHHSSATHITHIRPSQFCR